MDELAELLCSIQKDSNNGQKTEGDESKDLVEKISTALYRVFLFSKGYFIILYEYFFIDR